MTKFYSASHDFSLEIVTAPMKSARKMLAIKMAKDYVNYDGYKDF